MIFQDHLKAFVELLYPEFPREAGFPNRRMAFSYEHFLGEAHKEHQENPCFLNLYVDQTINKLWEDTDKQELQSMSQVYAETKFNYRLMVDQVGIDPNHITLVWSGKKGYHLYIANKPFKFEYAVLKDEEGREIPYNKTKVELDTIHQYLTSGSESADSPLFGDINRLVRMPGIQRPNKAFAIALDPEIIFGPDHTEFHQYFKEREFNWPTIFNECTRFLEDRLDSKLGVAHSNHAKNYFQTVLNIISQSGWKPTNKRKKASLAYRLQNKAVAAGNVTTKSGYAEAVDIILKDTLSNQNYWGIHVPNPIHRERITFALRLLHSGFTVDDVVDFAGTLHWIDFNPVTSRFYIEDLKGRYF